MLKFGVWFGTQSLDVLQSTTLRAEHIWHLRTCTPFSCLSNHWTLCADISNVFKGALTMCFIQVIVGDDYSRARAA